MGNGALHSPFQCTKRLFQDFAPRSAMLPAPCCPGFQTMTEDAWSRSTVMARFSMKSSSIVFPEQEEIKRGPDTPAAPATFSVFHGLGCFFPERDVLQPVNAAFGQVADSKVVMEYFRELAGLRARRGFQLHGQRAAQGKAKDGGGIGFIFRVESQGKQGIALLVHFLVEEAPFRSARYAVGRRAFLRTKPGPADGNLRGWLLPGKKPHWEKEKGIPHALPASMVG